MHRNLRRAGGWAAITAPILMWSAFLEAGLNRPGYDLLTRPFSDLATRGTDNAIPFEMFFFLVPGLLTVVVGVALWLAGGATTGWRIGSASTAAAGVLLFATGAFQQDPTPDAASILHRAVSQICFAVASIAPLVLFFAPVRGASPQPPRRIWLVTGIGAAALEITALTLRPVVQYPDGLFQRPFSLALTVWLIATGAWLLRMRGAQGPVTPG